MTGIERERRGRKNRRNVSLVAVLCYCLLDFQSVDTNF
jgi:hypothetical protein